VNCLPPEPKPLSRTEKRNHTTRRDVTHRANLLQVVREPPRQRVLSRAGQSRHSLIGASWSRPVTKVAHEEPAYERSAHVTQGETPVSRRYGAHTISGASAGTYSGCRGCPSFVTPNA
jgi:hypothetical protein